MPDVVEQFLVRVDGDADVVVILEADRDTVRGGAIGRLAEGADALFPIALKLGGLRRVTAKTPHDLRPQARRHACELFDVGHLELDLGLLGRNGRR